MKMKIEIFEQSIAKTYIAMHLQAIDYQFNQVNQVKIY